MLQSLITKIKNSETHGEGNSASALACKLADSYLLLAHSGIVVAKQQGFRLSGELNSSFLRSSGSAVQERVLPSRIKWLCTNTACSTALSRFYPRPPPPPVAHGSWLHGGRGPFVIYRECGFARYATAAPFNWSCIVPTNNGIRHEIAGRNNHRMHARIIAIAFLSIVHVRGSAAWLAWGVRV